MRVRTTGWDELLHESVRYVAQAALVALVLAAVLAIILFFVSGEPDWVRPFAVFFALAYLAGPMASASLRKRRGFNRFGPGAVSALVFCFAWGASVAVAFVGFLQLFQDMTSTAGNYVIAAVACGIVSAMFSLAPRGR